MDKIKIFDVWCTQDYITCYKEADEALWLHFTGGIKQVCYCDYYSSTQKVMRLHGYTGVKRFVEGEEPKYEEL